MKALEESVGYATDRYRYGLASYFEVLEAQQQLFPAQATLAQIRRDRLSPTSCSTRPSGAAGASRIPSGRIRSEGSGG